MPIPQMIEAMTGGIQKLIRYIISRSGGDLAASVRLQNRCLSQLDPKLNAPNDFSVLVVFWWITRGSEVTRIAHPNHATFLSSRTPIQTRLVASRTELLTAYAKPSRYRPLAILDLCLAISTASTIPTVSSAPNSREASEAPTPC